MNTRNLLHLGLLIPALAGVSLIVVEFTKATGGSLTDQSFAESTVQAWAKIAKVMPVEMPQEWPENETEDLTKSDELKPEQKIRFDENNAFILSCALLMLLGLIGIAMVGSAKTVHEPEINPLLRAAGIIGLSFFAFYFWGFNLSYPGGADGFLPGLSLGPPQLTDPVEYGMEGMNEYADLFYLSAYVAFFGILVISQTAAQQTAVSAFVPVIPMVAIAIPLTVSWKWGGGWLDMSFLTYDFAGAALFHWHAGVVALTTGVILKLFGRQRGQEGESGSEPSAVRLEWWIPGMLFYFLVMIGMNAGSVLAATPVMVAACLQSTFYAAIISAVLAGVWGIFLKTRKPYEWAVHGLLAGAVIVSGTCDTLTLSQSVILGFVAGLLIPPLIYLLDRFVSIDPLAVAGVHGIGGLIGTIAAVPFGEEISFMGQILMLLTVPLISVAFAAVSGILFGFTRVLFFKHRSPVADGPLGPPPLPQRR